MSSNIQQHQVVVLATTNMEIVNLGKQILSVAHTLDPINQQKLAPILAELAQQCENLDKVIREIL